MIPKCSQVAKVHIRGEFAIGFRKMHGLRWRFRAEMSSEEKMAPKEIDQFLACARVGRLGISLEDGPYIVPVGYAYANGKIFFHTCNKGLKMEGIRRNPNVCFEVDEALSDISMFKSVILFGVAEIVDDKEEMIPYLQKLIDKYRVPAGFDNYMSRPGRNREKELEAVRICVITPKKITGKKFVMPKVFWL